jgi:GTP-binding protein Era
MGEPDPEHEPRSGRCAIVGRPNVGKSTLLNALLRQKLAIATPKPQTTRTCVLGVYTQPSPPTQVAFLDTPGLHRPDSVLGRALAESLKAGMAEADVVLLLAAAKRGAKPEQVLGPEERELLASIGKGERPVILAINKVDRLKDKASLLPLLAHCQQAFPFAALVPISALDGVNLDGLLHEIRTLLPRGLRFDPEQLTDRPERFFVGELVREAVIRHTRQEVPYGAAVRIESFKDEHALTRISAVVIVDRDGHKGIVIGKGGERLKEIGTDARKQIEELLERKVFLELWVKVVPGWTDDPQRVKELTGS